MCAQLLSPVQLCDPMGCSPPGSSVHGIFQARILEWVATPFSRRSSPPRDQTHISCISCIGRWILYHWTSWELNTNSRLIYMWYIQNQLHNYIYVCVYIYMRETERSKVMFIYWLEFSAGGKNHSNMLRTMRFKSEIRCNISGRINWMVLILKGCL